MLKLYACIPPGKQPIQKAGVENIMMTSNDVYGEYNLNWHHWTTKYVWNVFLPKLCKDLDIDFNPDDFIKIENKSENGLFDLSYHIPKIDTEVDYENITFNEKRHCKISELRYTHDEAVTGLPVITYYHRLYLGCHKTSEIINENSKTDRMLILNTDSMSIPLVPILTYYFRKIIVLDNRNKIDYRKKLMEYIKNKNTSLVQLMIDFNWKNDYSKMNLNMR